MKKQSRENCPECLSLSPGLSCQSSASVQRSPGFLKATIVPDSVSMTIVESRKTCLRLARRLVSLSGFSLVKFGSRVSFTFAFSKTINFIFPSFAVFGYNDKTFLRTLRVLSLQLSILSTSSIILVSSCVFILLSLPVTSAISACTFSKAG